MKLIWESNSKGLAWIWEPRGIWIGVYWDHGTEWWPMDYESYKQGYDVVYVYVALFPCLPVRLRFYTEAA